ncbi:hypothetical protein [Burkholderia sp. IMCC1007]|uniref:hypothetical protein n=1 Tax=Burkholderia sp. IMCC1007 TaxID=3004104 RepID=UPI0022B42FEA|nr:hypothetical protein [Burkholderia sp. IMCC1007]
MLYTRARYGEPRKKAWRSNRDPEVRRLIREIVTLRMSLEKIMGWKTPADAGTDRGVFGGALGHFHRFYHLLHEEMRRAGNLCTQTASSGFPYPN